MLELNTERLDLILLTPGQLALLAEDTGALEQALNCRWQGQPVEGTFHAILQEQARRAAACSCQLPWHSFWLLLRRADRVAVGTADFKAPPDETGCVEIGYGLGIVHRGRGYMTEAVSALCAWAREQPEVRHIAAETEAYNAASRRVLARCGFVQILPGPTDRWEL